MLLALSVADGYQSRSIDGSGRAYRVRGLGDVLRSHGEGLGGAEHQATQESGPGTEGEGGLKSVSGP
jgi:hypothetical protein